MKLRKVIREGRTLLLTIDCHPRTATRRLLPQSCSPIKGSSPRPKVCTSTIMAPMALLHLCSAQTPRGDAPIHKFLSKLSLGGNLKVARPSIVTAADHPAAWFRRDLQNILANEDSQEVISWLPEGMIWRIHNLDAFRIQVIPQVPFISDFAHPLELFLAYVKANGFRGFHVDSTRWLSTTK
jgi:hypothetical protein